MNFPVLELAAVLAVIATALFLIDLKRKAILKRYYAHLERSDAIAARYCRMKAEGLEDTFEFSRAALAMAMADFKTSIYEVILRK